MSFLPVLIDTQLRPEVLRAEDRRFHELVDYMDWASEGFDHRFRIARRRGDRRIGTRLKIDG